MSYKPIGWKNYPDKTTPVNAENLNKMEQGIVDAHDMIGDTSRISDIGDGTIAGAIAEQNDALDNKKIVANPALLTFTNGMSVLDLSKYFDESLVITANLVNAGTNIDISGCNAVTPNNIVIGAKSRSTNENYTGEAWINYIAIGK